LCSKHSNIGVSPKYTGEWDGEKKYRDLHWREITEGTWYSVCQSQ
jgi:hypothetical protein